VGLIEGQQTPFQRPSNTCRRQLFCGAENGFALLHQTNLNYFLIHIVEVICVMEGDVAVNAIDDTNLTGL
jgi:hypothetical protein